MFKLCLVIALTVAGVAAQGEAPNSEAAPEPYSYAYSTDTHSAQEQRDPSGKVTGSYMLVGDDGRERRVEYIADENGFRAKVATNEVGTKSENSADVEVTASEPSPAQYAYVQSPPAPQVQYAQRQQVVQQVRPQVAQVSQVSQVAQAQRFAAAPIAVNAVQQPYGYRQVSSSYYRQSAPQTVGYTGYGYYPGYGYNSGANTGYYGSGSNAGYYSTGYGTAPGYANGASYGNGAGYGYGNGVGYTYGNSVGYTSSGLANVGNYNNHLPSQYYKSVSTTTQQV